MLIKKILILSIIFFTIISSLILPDTTPAFVQNTLAEIEKCKDKISLKLVRIWGGDDTDDENQFFRFPIDIATVLRTLIIIAYKSLTQMGTI